MDASQIGAWLGVVNATALFIMTASRKRRFDYTIIGPAGAGFFASYNLYPPFYLFYFIATPATRDTLPPALHGYDKYIGLAAVCSFLITLVAIVTLYKVAWKRT